MLALAVLALALAPLVSGWLLLVVPIAVVWGYGAWLGLSDRELLEAVDQVDNVAEVFASWRGGTVIRSWLLDLLVASLEEDEHLEKLTGYAEDSGEGRWTVEAAIDNAVPMHVIAASLFARFTSRQDDSPAMKAIAAMRNQFGGHAVRTAPPPGGEASGSDAPADTA